MTARNPRCSADVHLVCILYTIREYKRAWCFFHTYTARERGSLFTWHGAPRLPNVQISRLLHYLWSLHVHISPHLIINSSLIYKTLVIYTPPPPPHAQERIGYLRGRSAVIFRTFITSSREEATHTHTHACISFIRPSARAIIYCSHMCILRSTVAESAGWAWSDKQKSLLANKKKTTLLRRKNKRLASAECQVELVDEVYSLERDSGGSAVK